MIGNLKESKKNMISHYDTPSLIHDLVEFEPFEIRKRQIVSMIIDGIRLILLWAVLCVTLFTFARDILENQNFLIYSLLSLMTLFISIFLLRLPGFFIVKETRIKKH